MYLGVDLDNTLICYDEVFLWGANQLNLVPKDWVGDRKQLRRYMRSQLGGEEEWQRLQGKVYGEWIHCARLFAGVYRFLWRCRTRGIRVVVVSHKSEFGHFDNKKILLREVARNFLEQAGVFSDCNDSMIASLEFVPDQEQKIQAISRNNFDWFIDDLPEILESDNFPDVTNALGFDPDSNTVFENIERVTSWSELENRLLGQWTDHELRTVAQSICNAVIVDIASCEGGGNAQVNWIKNSDGVEAAVKIYSDDYQHDRLRSEYESTELLHRLGISQIPKPIGCRKDVKVAMYHWVKGKLVDDPTADDIEQALFFLKQIYEIRSDSQFRKIPNASAAVFSGHQLEEQFRERLRLLNKKAIRSRDLDEFLRYELEPTADEIIKWCKAHWPNKQRYNDSLEHQSRTLSPSDFGFHNALKEYSGRIIFLDFEYIGWDDPAKLVGDFILHPGMGLSDELKVNWVDGAGKLFGPKVISRLRVMWPLLGLCWCIILLNEFRQDGWARRTQAVGALAQERYKTLSRQLDRSKSLLVEIQNQYQYFPY